MSILLWWTVTVTPEDFILGIVDNTAEVAMFAAYDAEYTEVYQGFTVAPLADDVVVIEEPVYSDTETPQDGRDIDWSDWSWAQAPPNDDNDQEIQYGSLVDLEADFATDFADYSFSVDQAVPDNDQGFLPASVALDDQDYTDFSDYAFTVDPLSDDLREDALLGDGQGLDDQDWTDWSDYSATVDPLSDDASAAPEDQILGLVDLEPDWTDSAEYGSQTDPVGNDAAVVDDAVPLSVDADSGFADDADYSATVAPAVEDNDQEFLPASVALDDQDYTDWSDYSSTVAPAIGDNDQEFQPSSVVEPSDDQTDFGDYSSSVDAVQDVVAPDAPLLGIVDLEADATDFGEYGSQTDPVGDDLAETLLGIIEAEQDWTDYADYSFAQSAVAETIDDAPQGTVSDLSEYADPTFTDYTDYSFAYFTTPDDFVASGNSSGVWLAPDTQAWAAPQAARTWQAPQRESAWRAAAGRIWKAINREGWRR